MSLNYIAVEVNVFLVVYCVVLAGYQLYIKTFRKRLRNSLSCIETDCCSDLLQDLIILLLLTVYFDLYVNLEIFVLLPIV